MHNKQWNRDGVDEIRAKISKKFVQQKCYLTFRARRPFAPSGKGREYEMRATRGVIDCSATDRRSPNTVVEREREKGRERERRR